MTDRFESDDLEDGNFVASRIAYIKPTGSEEAHRLGLISANIDLPDGMKLYVLHAEDGSVLGFTTAMPALMGRRCKTSLPRSVSIKGAAQTENRKAVGVTARGFFV